MNERGSGPRGKRPIEVIAGRVRGKKRTEGAAVAGAPSVNVVSVTLTEACFAGVDPSRGAERRTDLPREASSPNEFRCGFVLPVRHTIGPAVTAEEDYIFLFFLFFVLFLAFFLALRAFAMRNHLLSIVDVSGAPSLVKGNFCNFLLSARLSYRRATRARMSPYRGMTPI